MLVSLFKTAEAPSVTFNNDKTPNLTGIVHFKNGLSISSSLTLASPFRLRLPVISPQKSCKVSFDLTSVVGQ